MKDVLAVLLEHVELLVALEDEALKYERCLSPRPVQLEDIHPERQFIDRYFTKFHASNSVSGIGVDSGFDRPEGQAKQG
jgi:hypothetical protein